MARSDWNRLNVQARAGDPEAQWQLGSWLQDGVADARGVVLTRPGSRSAVTWYRRSAIGGSPAGQIHFGVCLCYGRGVRRHQAEALRWFKRAYRQDESCAAANIASLCRDWGNHRRALFWYRRAVNAGDGDALVDLGRGYYTGIGVRRDAKRAVRFFREAMSSEMITQPGREDAMFRLAIAFHEGRGVQKSDARAMQWLSRANRDEDHVEARQLIEAIARGHQRRTAR